MTVVTSSTAKNTREYGRIRSYTDRILEKYGKFQNLFFLSECDKTLYLKQNLNVEPRIRDSVFLVLHIRGPYSKEYGPRICNTKNTESRILGLKFKICLI